MRGGAVVILLGFTAFAASAGHNNATANQPVEPVHQPYRPVALASVTVEPQSAPAPQLAQAVPSKPVQPDIKRKVEIGLTAAAIAAIIVKESRDQYYATGHPCACPDDKARNGSSCGARSAYSRPGGASPLCYPGDVTAAMIDAYRQRQKSP